MSNNINTTNLPIRTTANQGQRRNPPTGTVPQPPLAGTPGQQQQQPQGQSTHSLYNRPSEDEDGRVERLHRITLEINTLLSDFHRQLHLCSTAEAEGPLYNLWARLTVAREGMEMMSSPQEGQGIERWGNGWRQVSMGGLGSRVPDDEDERLGLSLD